MALRAPVCAYVAYGSNVEPEQHVFAAFQLLRRYVIVTGVSTAYWTAPIGRPGDPPFLNGVWRVNTMLGARAFKKSDVLSHIEDRLGRVRTTDKFAPRTIDLDLVLYDNDVCDERDLRLPHPDIARPFVGVPILELDPDLRIPGMTGSLASLFADSQGPQPAAMPAPGTPHTALTRKMREEMADEC